MNKKSGISKASATKLVKLSAAHIAIVLAAVLNALCYESVRPSVYD